MKIKRAVFPVGGWGTRFLPATKAIPKAMFPIIDKPIIHYIVEEAVYSGIEQIIFIMTANNRAIEDYFNRSSELESLLEKKNKQVVLKQMQEISTLAYFCSTPANPRGHLQGLGIGVLNAKSLVREEPFAVLLPNDLIDAEVPCMTSLVAIFDALQCPVLAVQKVPEEKISTYGNIGFCELKPSSIQKLKDRATYNFQKVYEITQLIQKPDPHKHEHLSNLAIIGRYILPPEIFPILEEIPPGYEGEVQLTDALEVLRKNGQKMYAYEFEGDYYDTRSKPGYFKACLNFALKQPELAKEIKQDVYQCFSESH